MSIQMEALAEAIRDRVPLAMVRYIDNDNGGKIDIGSSTLHKYGSEIYVVGDIVGGFKSVGLISDPDLVEKIVALGINGERLTARVVVPQKGVVKGE